MIKKLIKKILFADTNKQKIVSGPAKGMLVKYNTSNRLQHLLGLYEREIYPYLKKAIKKANVLIDIGANDGYYVLAFLKAGKPVIACEPGPIVDELIANTNLNGFAMEKDYKMETRLVGSSGDTNFVSIDSLTKGTERPCFILVDIDGGERDLLTSCGESFDHSAMTWLVETHSPELEEQCISFFKEYNYKITVIKNAWWRFFIPEQRPLEQNRWLYAEKQ